MGRGRSGRTVCVLLGLLAYAVVAQAQPFAAKDLSTTTCPGAGCLAVQVDGQGSLGVQITGTFVGTVTFEQSIDGTTYVTLSMIPSAGGALVTSTTGTGLWTGPIAGARWIRVRVSAYTSGTVTVSTVNTAARLERNGAGAAGSFSSVSVGDGSAGAPSLTFASSTTDGLFYQSSHRVSVAINGGTRAEFNAAGTSYGLDLGPNALYFGASLASPDLYLLRDGAANTLAQRNGTNAQTWNVYNTTDGTNKEYGSFTWNANVFQIGASRTGTGVQRILAFAVNGSNKWSLDPNGNLTGVTASGGIGYSAGAGGAVSQATSRTTGVTLNTVSGDITLFSAAGSATAASFTVTNSAVAAVDNIVINQKSGTNLYNVIVTTVGAGSFVVTFYTTGGTATDAPVFHFSVVKGANS